MMNEEEGEGKNEMKLLLVLLVEAVSVDIDEVGLHIVSIRACHHGEVVQGALTRLPQVPQVRARMPPPWPS